MTDMSASTELTFALYHAIAFLTRSLIGRYSVTTIDLLHFTLERNLTKQYENNWFRSEPHRGSGRRCLTLIPNELPPRPIYYACKYARISWDEWMVCLGNTEMDLFIDPGCVFVRFARLDKSYIVWSACVPTRIASNQKPTVSQSIIDEDEDELFNMINDQIRAPTWLTPILNQFPPVPRNHFISPFKLTESEPESAVSTISTRNLLSVTSGHSRSSSRSSDSCFSFSSVESTGTTATSLYLPSTIVLSRPGVHIPMNRSRKVDSILLPANALIMQAPFSLDNDNFFDADMNTMSEKSREDLLQSRVVIDVTKKEVTPYDGGKTTVLTGGVMLGCKPGVSSPTPPPSTPRFASATFHINGRNGNWSRASVQRLRF